MREISEKQNIKSQLLEKLKLEKAFWSYSASSISLNNYSDERLIADTLRYLDISDINSLFTVYPFNFIKSSWRKLLIPEGEYLHTLNRFLAWYFFDIKDPDRYLKSIHTRNFNKLLRKI